MARRSILARYDAAANLDQRMVELGAPTLGPALSPIHTRAVEVMGDMLSLGAGAVDTDTPQVLRTMLVLLRRSQPMLLDLVGKVPPEAIVSTMTKLRDDIQSILDLAEEEGIDVDQADDGPRGFGPDTIARALAEGVDSGDAPAAGVAAG